MLTFLKRLAGGSLLLGIPLASAAQATDASLLPRYYVGLGAYSSAYQSLGGSYYQGVRVPVQLTLGYQLRPRLAVQLGVAYSGRSYDYFGAGRYYTGSAAAASPYAYYEYYGASRQRNVSLAPLVRYTLTRQPAHRFQVDILGGFTLEHSRYSDASTSINSDSTRAIVVTTHDDYQRNQTTLLLTAGASARYRFGRHLEAVLDVTFSQNLVNGRTAQFSGLTGATALGLRYRFGYP